MVKELRHPSKYLGIQLLRIRRNSTKLFYRKAIGSLLYLANGTRPDLAFLFCYLSQLNNDPIMKNWNDVKHLLRYLKATTNLNLTYSKRGLPISVYVDADWANNKDDRKSFSGFVICLANAAIIWQTRKQRIVALSTVEAEYVAMTEVVKEVLWLQHFLNELNLSEFIMKPCMINVDNQGAIALSKNVIISDRSKHIDVKLHFLKDRVDKEDIYFNYISSKDNFADLFTKVLNGSKTKEITVNLGLNDIISNA